MNMSRKRLLAGAVAVVVSMMAGAALAQNSATASATASATVAQPLAVAKSADLAFGRVIRPSSGNATVYTVSEVNGAASVAGGDGVFTAGAGSPGRAVFTVTGEGGQTFSITSDTSVTNGGVTINLVKSGVAGTLDGTLGTIGTATFGVGGNVTLSDTSPTGTKAGSFNVTIAYQ